MPKTTRKERNERRRHALEIVSDGYGWGDATKIIENTYSVSRRTAIRDVDLAFEGLVETFNKKAKLQNYEYSDHLNYIEGTRVKS